MTKIDFSEMSELDVRYLVLSGCNDTPEAHLAHWISIARNFGTTRQTDDYHEFSRLFSIMVGKLVMAEREIKAIRDDMWQPAKSQQQKYNEERNEMLLSGDVDKMQEFTAKHTPQFKAPTRQLAEVAMHKSITAISSLPYDYRMKSKKWLDERHYTSLDDGDLSPKESEEGF